MLRGDGGQSADLIPVFGQKDGVELGAKPLAEAAAQQGKRILRPEAGKAGDSTVFFLIDRLSAVISIPFEGEPLQGLQIMGMLETRCLDFEKVIILSCDERVLPRKFRSNSFISANCGFGACCRYNGGRFRIHAHESSAVQNT